MIDENGGNGDNGGEGNGDDQERQQLVRDRLRIWQGAERDKAIEDYKAITPEIEADLADLDPQDVDPDLARGWADAYADARSRELMNTDRSKEEQVEGQRWFDAKKAANYPDPDGDWEPMKERILDLIDIEEDPANTPIDPAEQRASRRWVRALRNMLDGISR